MAFFKKSEDPWDLEPKRPGTPVPPVDGAPEESVPLTDKARAFFGMEKKEPETLPEPIPCPWCGKMMETGYLAGDRGVWWAPGLPTLSSKWMGPSSAEGAWRVTTLGTLYGHQTAWFCEDCRKLVVDIPEVESRYEEYHRQMEEAKRRRENGGD